MPATNEQTPLSNADRVSYSEITDVGPIDRAIGSESESEVSPGRNSDANALTEEQSTERHWNIKLQQLQTIPWYRRPNLVFINFACFLYTLSSVGEPTRQIIRFKYACNSLLENGTCDSIDTQLLVSSYNQYSLILSQICLIIAICHIGKLSDKYGRKVFINLIVSVVLISRLILLFAYQNHQLFQLKLYLVCDVIASSMGGLYGFIGLANSYTADIVAPNKRTHVFGYILGSLFAGETLGPLISSMISKALSKVDNNNIFFINGFSSSYSKLAFLESSILSVEILVFVILLLYSLFWLPESTILNNHQPESQLQVELEFEPHHLKPHLFSWKSLPSWSPLKLFNFLAPLKLLFLPKTLVKPQFVGHINRIRILILFLVLFNVLLSVYLSGVAQIIIQYSVYKFDWDSANLANMMATSSLSNVIVLFVISPFISNQLFLKLLTMKSSKLKIDNKDFSLLAFGLFFNTILYGGLSLAKSSFLYLMAIIIGNLGSVLQPTILSTLLKYYPESKTAEVVMALSLNYGIGSILAPFFAVNLFKMGLTHKMPQLVFIVCCCINVVVFMGLFMLKRLLSRHQ